MKTRNGLSWKEASLLGVKVSLGKKQKRIDKYNLDPSICKFCKRSLPYQKRNNKFCDHSCSASFNNLGIVRNFKEFSYEEYLAKKDLRNNYSKKECLYCKKETINFKFCSHKCNFKYKKQQKRERIKRLGSLINYKNEKWYLIEIRSHICEICGNSKWNKEDIPLDIHHKDGNSDNNKLGNLLLLCPNCHRQTDNHGSKNRKNGKDSKRKKYRKDRYDKGLSY